MGCVTAKEEFKEQREQSKIIDERILRDRQDNNRDRRINGLILGPKGSGKTTLLKQLKVIYGMEFNHKEKEFIRDEIRKKIISIMKSFVVFYENFSTDFPNSIQVFLFILFFLFLFLLLDEIKIIRK